jgi:hypothetical protein
VRAQIRIREGRAKPIDILALSMNLDYADMEVALDEPSHIFEVRHRRRPPPPPLPPYDPGAAICTHNDRALTWARDGGWVGGWVGVGASRT